MSNETIATETTEAVGELPIDELLSDGITNTPPSFVRAILAARLRPRGDLLRWRPAQPHLIPAGGAAGIDAACGGRARR